MSIVSRALVCLALLALGAGGASAHPHLFIDAKAELVFNPAGEMVAVRNIWQFDKAFTAFATQGLDANRDGKLSDAELKPLAQTNIESLKEYKYFTFLKLDGQEVAFETPKEYWLQFVSGRLTLFFTLPLAKPVAPRGKTVLEIYDPEYFVAITFVKETPFKLEAAPKACKFQFQQPGALDQSVQTKLSAIPADQRDIPPEMQDYTALLANRFHITC